MSSKFDALHAEILGDLQELIQLLERTRVEMPAIVEGLQGESQKATAQIERAFLDFHGQSLALAEFIKKRKEEMLADLEASNQRSAGVVKVALAAFRNSLWVLGGLSVVNLALTVAVLAGAK